MRDVTLVYNMLLSVHDRWNVQPILYSSSHRILYLSLLIMFRSVPSMILRSNEAEDVHVTPDPYRDH